jgi:rhodanese-related sulfurtransferase
MQVWPLIWPMQRRAKSICSFNTDKNKDEVTDMEFAIINAKQLHDKINAGEAILILDVRASDAYNSWKINSKGLQSVNVPHTDILEDKESAYEQLNKNTEIVIVCNKGNAARLAAEKLAGEGYQVSVLDKGMWEWSQFYHAVTVAEDESMKLIQFNRLGKGCLSYMVISEGQALVVDAGRHIDEYLNLAEAEQVKIAHVMDTHVHADHISGGMELSKQAGATY